MKMPSIHADCMVDIHLTAVLEHPNIAKLKPEATQILLKQALRTHPSELLEMSQNEYYVRRKPSTNPLPFVPVNSFDIVDDDGLSFWDQRTIYVEPHLRNICPTPARVAQWLADHGELKSKWLPIQAVHTLWNSCAFVVLSGNVMHEGTWSKWRETGKPDDWKIMTKVEHTRRTAEYLALLEKENPRGMRKVPHDKSQLPPIARPAALPMAFEPLPETDPVNATADTNGEGKKKRKRRKPAKPNQPTDAHVEPAEHTVHHEAGPEPDTETPAPLGDAQSANTEQSANKKKRKRRKSGKTNIVDETDDAGVAANTTTPTVSSQPSKKRRR